MRAFALAALLSIGSLTVASGTHAAMLPTGVGVGVEEEEDQVTVTAFDAERERLQEEARPRAQRQHVYQRTSDCLAPAGSGAPCPSVLPPTELVCEEGDPKAPLWRRKASDVGAIWVMLSEWACPEDLIPPFTQADLQKLRIAPLEVHHQPAHGPMLITKPLIVYTEPSTREFQVELLDVFQVDVVVAPKSYTWDFGDGEVLTTADPGRPYPAFDLTHVYEELGTAQISLTTTWQAKYRVHTDPLHKWRDVDGTARTVHEGEEFEVIELRTKLVD